MTLQNIDIGSVQENIVLVVLVIIILTHQSKLLSF